MLKSEKRTPGPLQPDASCKSCTRSFSQLTAEKRLFEKIGRWAQQNAEKLTPYPPILRSSAEDSMQWPLRLKKNRPWGRLAAPKKIKMPKKGEKIHANEENIQTREASNKTPPTGGGQTKERGASRKDSPYRRASFGNFAKHARRCAVLV